MRVAPFLEHVKNANNGSLKLPIFQREFVWNGKQVEALYDSLRLKYPIGSLLLMEYEDSKLDSEFFWHSDAREKNPKKDPKFLVFDGQQRLTVGIDLFYGSAGGRGRIILST